GDERPGPDRGGDGRGGQRRPESPEPRGESHRHEEQLERRPAPKNGVQPLTHQEGRQNAEQRRPVSAERMSAGGRKKSRPGMQDLHELPSPSSAGTTLNPRRSLKTGTAQFIPCGILFHAQHSGGGLTEWTRR